MVSKDGNSSRVIPFDVSLRVELCIDRFLDRYEEFQNHDPPSIGEYPTQPKRPVLRVGSIHCLRATAASFHAYQGVPPVPLQAMMGWNDLSTAQKYIRISGAATAKASRNVHR